MDRAAVPYMNLRDNIIFKDCGSVKAGYDSVYLCPLCHPTSSSDRAKGVEFRYALNKMNTVLDSLGLSSAVKSTRLVNYYDKMLLDSIR